MGRHGDECGTIADDFRLNRSSANGHSQQCCEYRLLAAWSNHHWLAHHDFRGFQHKSDFHHYDDAGSSLGFGRDYIRTAYHQSEFQPFCERAVGLPSLVRRWWSYLVLGAATGCRASWAIQSAAGLETA